MNKLIYQFLLTFSLSVATQAALATDLMDVYQQSLVNDPIFQAAKSTQLSKQETLPQNRASLLPNLSASANTAKNYYHTLDAIGTSATAYPDSVKYNSNGYTINLTQSLINFGNWMKVSQADASVKQANADFGTATQDLIIRVARAYFNVLLAQDNLTFAHAEKAANARQFEQAKQRFEVGLSTVTTVYDAQAAYDKSVAQEITAENTLHNNQEALRQLTSSSYSDIENVKIALPLLTPQPADIQQWLDASQKYNLSLLSQRYATEAARQNIKVNNAGHLPTIDAIGSYTRTNGANYGTLNAKQAAIGIQLNVPLFQGGLVASKTRQAEDDYATASANRENTYRSVMVTTRQKFNDVLAGISKIKADRQAVLSTQSSSNSTEEQFRVGTSTMVDVLLAQKSVFDAKRNLASDEYTYLLDTLLLKQSAGTLSPNDLQAINQWLHAQSTKRLAKNAKSTNVTPNV